jgi:hypothetical protein
MNKLLKPHIDYRPLFEAIDKTNEVIFIGYMFIRGFIMYCFDNNINITINVKFIQAMLSTVYCSDDDDMYTTIGNVDGNITHDIVEYWYDFSREMMIGKVIAKNISNSINNYAESMYIAIVNNLDRYLEKHIAKALIVAYETYYNDTYSKGKLSIKKMAHSILCGVRGTYTDIEKNCIGIVVRETSFKCPFYESKAQLEKYLYKYTNFSYNLNKYIQYAHRKNCQFFPLRTDISNKHIVIGTQSLVKIMTIKDKFYYINRGDDIYTVDKGYLKDNSGDKEVQEFIWNYVFGFQDQNVKSILRRDGYTFNYQIATDGYCVSVELIKNEDIAKNDLKKANRKNRQVQRKLLDKQFKNDKAGLQKELDRLAAERDAKDKKYRADSAKAKKKRKEEYKKLSDNAKIKLYIEGSKNETIKAPYFDKIYDDPLFRKQFEQKRKDGKLLFIDPGKRSPFYGMCLKPENPESNMNFALTTKNNRYDNFGITHWKDYKVLNYTMGCRLKYLKSSYYHNASELLKKRVKDDDTGKSLKQIHDELSKYSSKTCNQHEYLEFVWKKYCHFKFMNRSYTDYYLKKNYVKHLSRSRHESQLINVIQRQFGRDVWIIIGDWSGCNKLKNNIPTPNVHLMNLLTQNFKVFLINEHKTSKIHYATDVECSNVIVERPKEYIEKDIARYDGAEIVNKYGFLEVTVDKQQYAQKVYREFIYRRNYAKGLEKLRRLINPLDPVHGLNSVSHLNQQNMPSLCPIPDLNLDPNINNISQIKRIPLTKHIHGLLLFKKAVIGKPCVSGWINRDKNACLNFQRLYDHYMQHKTRLPSLN